MKKEILDAAVIIRKQLTVESSDYNTLSGKIKLDNLNEIRILLDNNLIEIYNFDTPIYKDDITSHKGEELDIEFQIGNIGEYYENFDEFIEGNKLYCKHEDFYIANLDYREGIDSDYKISDYKKTITLIDFLRKLCDSEKIIGNTVELFFYKTQKGANLNINYNEDDLLDISLSEAFIEHIIEQPENDKKILFKTELIIFLQNNGDSFSKVIQGWNILIENYNKSYSLFLSGFSFEKIKTSSTEYFQKLVDRIYESIAKVSNYIFGVPIGYILLINNFDFSGLSIGKNFALLLLGIIFFILIWYVLFKNIDESIEAIETDIDDFIVKIENNKDLSDISTKLNILKNQGVNKQKNKLILVKILSWLIFLIVIFIYIHIFIDISIFYL